MSSKIAIIDFMNQDVGLKKRGSLTPILCYGKI